MGKEVKYNKNAGNWLQTRKYMWQIYSRQPVPASEEDKGGGGMWRIRSRSKDVGPPPGSVSLGLGLVIFIAGDIYIVTNFYVMERAYDMTLGLKELNAYAVKFVLNTTNYTVGNRPPLQSKYL